MRDGSGGTEEAGSSLTGTLVALQQSMPASQIPATTKATARRPPRGSNVSVLQAGQAPRVPQVSRICWAYVLVLGLRARDRVYLAQTG